MALRPRWLRVVHLVSASASLLLVTSVTRDAQAQSPVTLQAFEKEPHLGHAQDALVGITVVNTARDGSVQTRHGNGLLLRCDGFVLVPEALFFTDKTGNNEATKPNQRITVVLHPGTSQQQAVKGRRPGWFGWVEWGNTRQHLGYAVLKLDNVHSPAMRPLLPDTLIPGSPLTLAWSAWDESKQAFEPVQTRPVTVGERPTPAKDDNTPPLYRAQFTPLQSPLEAVMPGAVVVTEEDLVAGIVPGLAPANVSRFANFASLSQATNCVTTLPTGDDAFVRRNRFSHAPSAPLLGTALPPGVALPFAPQQKPLTPAEKRQRDVAASAPEMVRVPGGPVKLPPSVQDLQLDMESSRVACVPPFLIDRYEVTNAQYWEFWKALPDEVRKNPNWRTDLYPYGWGAEAEPFPATLAQVPVLGVRLPGARAYAKWAGKRLPTPYEWCLAAFGPTGGNEAPDWAKRFLKQRKDVWNKVVQAHEQYARQHTAILPRFLLASKQVPVSKKDFIMTLVRDNDGNFSTIQDETHPSIAEFFHLPWFFYKPGFQDDAAWSKQTIEELTDPLFQEWNDPMYVLPVGSRPYDISPYGVLDMALNAKELIAPSPIFPWNAPPRPGWPFREADRYIEIKWGISDVKQRRKEILEYDNRYAANIGFVSPEVVQTRLNDPETILHLMPFGVNPLRLWVGTPNYISSGFMPTPASSPFGLYDRRLPGGMEDRYDNYLLSRRLRSASENVRPNSVDYVIADLSSYVSAYSAMVEYNEILHPADDMIVDLQPGPIYDTVYYPGGETILHNWVWDPHLGVTHWVPSEKMKYKLPEKWWIEQYAPPSMVDKPAYVNGSWIRNTGSFPIWRGMPRHFHYEMGHPLGMDHDRPYSDNDRPQYNVKIDVAANKKTWDNMPVSMDTFLMAGGFRCVR